MKDSKLSCVALYTLSDSDSDSDYNVEDYPRNIPDLIRIYGRAHVADHITESVVESVADITTGQAENKMWEYQRRTHIKEAVPRYNV